MSDREFFSGKTAWITGGSSGIGEAIAKHLAGCGAKVIVSSFDVPELNRVVREIQSSGGTAFLLPFDLSNPIEVEAAAEKVLLNHKRVDFLFNNGGVSQRTSAIDTPIETDRKIMEINYFSGIILSKKLLPSMIKNGGGHIIATSSISGLFGFHLRSAYAASKHALHGFYESVWIELHYKNIKTTLICPGRVRTNISLHALGKDGKPHGRLDPGQARGISPEKCAEKIVRAVRKNRRQVLIGGKELIMARLKRFLPSVFYWLVLKIKPF